MGPDDERRRQLRLALSMNGGVSLCVWIGGAVAEIDEMRRGQGFWGDLLQAAGYQRAAQVDVMAGASAGGLNAVMLAAAIQANRPFDEFFPLWLDAADIERLVKPPSEALAFDRRAVLDGRYFLHALHDALEQAERRRTGEAPTQALAVFASATMVRANTVSMRDVPGAPIVEARSDAYFHVARRGSAARGLDGFADGEGVVDNLTALAMIGRATSSLPGLFEPVTFDRDTFGSRLVGAFRGDRPSVEIMDGGVVDNVPIGRAIRAVSHIPATGLTRRVLLYLHPDPGGATPTAAARPDVSPDPDTVVKVARSFSGKRSETIREDIDLLRHHNDAVARRDAQARVALERVLGGTTETSVSGQVRAMTAAMLLRAAVDPSTELLWHAPSRPRVAPLLDAPGDTLDKDALARAFRDVVDSDPNVLVADRVHRTVSALQRVARMALQESPALGLGPTLRRLNELQLLCHLVTSFQLGRMLDGDASTAAAPAARLEQSARELAAFTVPNGLGDAAWRGLASWQLPDARPGGRTLAGEMDEMLTHALADIPSTDGDGLGCRVLRWLAAQPRRTVAARDLADALLPLRAEPVASDQHIDFVRIAGNVDTPASRRFVGDDPAANRRRYGDRIAGKQLHHLGAFFDREWRANDLRWGRLDSVPALVDAVLDDDALGALRADAGLLPVSMRAQGTTRDEIRDWLIARRQEQLLARFAADESFQRWAARDRRLVSLLGGRRLTGTAIKAAITATRVGAAGQSPGKRAMLVALRPVVLALTGVLLAGRWATAAMAWTLCVLAATRQDGPTERWLWWYAGVVLCLAVAAAVELGVKPVRRWWRTGPPYLLAVAGIATGLWFALHHDWITSPATPHDVPWVWLLPAVAAGLAALALFFWMAAPVAVAMATLAGAWYGWIAYAASDPAAASPWPVDWPFHSTWIAWLVAVLGLPVVVGRLPSGWLGPSAPRT